MGGLGGVLERTGTSGLRLETPPTRPLDQVWDFTMRGKPYGPSGLTREEAILARNAGAVEAERAVQPKMFVGNPDIAKRELDDPVLRASLERFLSRQSKGGEIVTYEKTLIDKLKKRKKR
jgi:hypothetical protein